MQSSSGLILHPAFSPPPFHASTLSSVQPRYPLTSPLPHYFFWPFPSPSSASLLDSSLLPPDPPSQHSIASSVLRECPSGRRNYLSASSCWHLYQRFRV